MTAAPGSAPATGLYRHLPNALTILRLFLAAGFFAALNAYRHPDVNTGWAVVSIGLFILAAITDALDGWLARRWQATSVFGRVMDPFCDKVLILGAFMCLAGPRFVVREWVEAGSFFTNASGVYPWMVVVIMARELLVTGIRGEVEAMGGNFASSWSGKAKMILQSIAIPIIIALVVCFDPGREQNAWARWACNALVYATVIVTVWSGLPYVFRARAALEKASPDGSGGS
jgi:CDP-diacylglycerol--glycerol-3-phosphate 3-phosphatidyltransferase